MGEIKESKGDVNEAIEYLERAADLYAGEEVKSTGNNCLLKARGGSARWRPCILAAGWSRPKLGAFWARSKPAAAGSRNPLEEPPLPICRLHPLAHPELPPPPQSAAPFPTFLPCVRPASATLAIPPSARPPVRASVRPVRLVVPHAVLSQTLCILSPSMPSDMSGRTSDAHAPRFRWRLRQVATLSAQVENYPRAIELFMQVSR